MRFRITVDAIEFRGGNYGEIEAWSQDALKVRMCCYGEAAWAYRNQLALQGGA